MIVTDRDRAAARARRPGDRVGAVESCTATSSGSRTPRSLFGSRAMLTKVREGDDPAAIAASWSADEEQWRLTRAKYLLY